MGAYLAAGMAAVHNRTPGVVEVPHPSITWELTEKCTAIATTDQLTRLANYPKRELIRRGLNQRTLEKSMPEGPYDRAN